MRYIYKDMPLPMTRALYNVDSNLVTRATEGVGHLSLKAKFKQPGWFQQDDHGRVVPSESKVPDFLGLSIVLDNACNSEKLEVFEKLESPQLQLRNVKVTLLELISCVATEKGICFTDTIKRLRSKEISNLDCSERLIWLKPSDKLSWSQRCSVPINTYDCKLPHLGPTFCSGSFRRSYGVEVTVEIATVSSEESVSLKSFTEICIAKEIYNSSKAYKAFGPDSMSFSWGVETLVILEEFERDSYQPKEVSARQLRDSNSLINSLESVSVNLPIKYKSHQSQLFSVLGKIYSVTTLDIVSRRKYDKNRFETALKRDGVASNFTNGPVVGKRSVIVCEVLKPSEFEGETYLQSGQLFGGTFLKKEDVRIMYSFPMLHPLYQFTPNNDPSNCRTTFTHEHRLPHGMPQELTLSSRFKRHDRFVTQNNSKTVVPGMLLSELFELQIHLPHTYGDASKLCLIPPTDLSFIVQTIHVDISATVSSNSFEHSDYWTRSYRMLNKRCEANFPWSSFEKCITDESHAFVTLPKEFFDVAVPNLGPTFYSRDLYRSYEVRIGCVIHVPEATWWKTLYVCEAIEVAADKHNCLSSSNSPPQYHKKPEHKLIRKSP
ncbi:hypothetical protein FT663_04186 [Candidozyma haemuli var. vulneris]|nr:hypothetical protein FT662_04329 [[Candida] haemuloni var. vulneris]KAF3988064.1 hypothetical protein FT663_04186 [[Candida] haemuloni var. vulneris]